MTGAALRVEHTTVLRTAMLRSMYITRSMRKVDTYINFYSITKRQCNVLRYTAFFDKRRKS